MSDVLYRSLNKSDYDTVKNLICEAFGFSEFIKDTKTLDYLLTIYLESCILDSSFSQVAVKDNTVIGIILGNAKNDKNKIRSFYDIKNLLTTIVKLAFSSKENKRLMKEFSKIQNAYNEIIEGKKDDFQGCIQLFIVSKECRGLGVGKSLVSNLLEYMSIYTVKSLYLYTDTRCNYGFYDSQNFKRINEKEIHFSSLNESLNVFLYAYNL